MPESFSGFVQNGTHVGRRRAERSAAYVLPEAGKRFRHGDAAQEN
jgi:hypothetical protein